MSTMRVVQVPRPSGPLEIVEREVPDPAAGQVRIRVDSQEALAFSVLAGVRSMNEVFPFTTGS